MFAVSMSETRDSDSNRLQSCSATENQRTQTKTHRKTPLVEACKPIHISDARNQRRGAGGCSSSSRSNTDLNHEEECNSSVSGSNSIERNRSPKNISRITPTHNTPSTSSSASREGTATDRQLSDLELDPHKEDLAEVFNRPKERKHTVPAKKLASSDKEADIQGESVAGVYSRLESNAEEELHHEGDDELEDDENDENSQEIHSTPQRRRSSEQDKIVFNPNPNQPLCTSHQKQNLSKFPRANTVALADESAIIHKLNKIKVPLLKKSKFTDVLNMVAGGDDTALNGDTVERQELTALDSSTKKSILKASHNIGTVDESDDAPDGYITQLDKDGNIVQVPASSDEKGDDNPLTEFMSADFMTKPFNFVAGSATKSRFNPFRKKSGLLNVLARQSTRNRIIAKNGTLNTVNASTSNRFWKDIFITMLDINWGWIFLLFSSAFFSSWLSFAVIWYLTFLQHGDFEEVNMKNESFVPCALAIQDFTSCFLFSLETQHTIGYGGRATTEQCPFAIIVMSLQSIMGVIIQACMAGIIFAKFTVPRARGETIIYSKNAVITLRNGALYLLCRVSDLRKSSLLEAHVRMLFVKKEVTEEGEVIPYYQFDLECGSELDGSNDRVLMLWPTTIAHKIDDESPLYEMNPRDLLSSQFEIILTLEGVTEETGNTVQVRTSYLPNEILWGHHFDNNVVLYDKKLECHIVVHGIVNKTSTDDTPRLSAKQMERRKAKESKDRCQSSGGVSITDSTQSEESPDKAQKISRVSTAPGGPKSYKVDISSNNQYDGDSDVGRTTK